MSIPDFAGRVAIVTGGGTGLGRCYALELARRGCRVVVSDLPAGDGGGGGTADRVVAEIVAAGGEAIAAHESVATRAGGAAIVERALDGFGRLDILISNAGILRSGRFEELSEADIDDVFAVHLKGAFNVGQPAFAAMKRQKYGRILLAASSSGVFGHPWQASYGAAKAGLVGLSNVIALEGRDFGVLSNVIMPNARTAMTDVIDFSWAGEIAEMGAALRELAENGLQSRERLDPEWVAPLALHLVSERCETTHGVFSAVNGRYARVFTGVTEGWVAPLLPDPQDVADNWRRVVDAGRHSEPANAYDETLGANKALRRHGIA